MKAFPGLCAEHGGLMWSNAMRACITPDDVIRGGCRWQPFDGGDGMTLLDACREVMRDRAVIGRYPKGLASADVLYEIRAKYPDAFPLVSVLDVADEMRSFFGPGR